MRKVAVLIVVSLAALLSLASLAMAQEKPIFTSSKDAREGEGYEVFKDGTFIIGGDVMGDCPSLVEDARASGTENSREIARQVEVCTRAGFPPRGGASLPDTGGAPVLPLALALILGICALGIGP